MKNKPTIKNRNPTIDNKYPTAKNPKITNGCFEIKLKLVFTASMAFKSLKIIKGTANILNKEMVMEPNIPNIGTPVKLSTEEIPKLIIEINKVAKNNSLK